MTEILLIIMLVIIIASLILYMAYHVYIEAYSPLPFDNKIEEIIERLRPMLARKSGPFLPPLDALNNYEVLDEVTIRPGRKSHILNKKIIYLCLRNKDTNEYYDMDTLLHKTLHEIAHFLCPNPEPLHQGPFDAIFFALIDRAKEYNVYHSDYEPPIKDYC